MIRVIVESPYAGDIERNQAYARLCCQDCLQHFEAPFAAHLLYTQFLTDTDPHDRHLGMIAGFEWTRVADRVVFYVDLGISPGMRLGEKVAKKLGIPVEYRALPLTALASFRESFSCP